MRVKRGNVARNRRKKVLKQAKGFRGGLSKLFRPAHQAVLNSLRHSYRDRRLKKRVFRRLWTVRLNASLRLRGTTYSRFIHAMDVKNVRLNRKVLSNLAISHPAVFDRVVTLVNQ